MFHVFELLDHLGRKECAVTGIAEGFHHAADSAIGQFFALDSAVVHVMGLYAVVRLGDQTEVVGPVC